jgi:hypothetical protein
MGWRGCPACLHNIAAGAPIEPSHEMAHHILPVLTLHEIRALVMALSQMSFLQQFVTFDHAGQKVTGIIDFIFVCRSLH